MSKHYTDLRGAVDSMGSLRPVSPEEEARVRQGIWEAAERWRVANKRTHRRKRVYYQEVCLALGIMDTDQVGADWRRWNRWVLGGNNRAFIYTKRKADQ